MDLHPFLGLQVLVGAEALAAALACGKRVSRRQPAAAEAGAAPSAPPPCALPAAAGDKLALDRAALAPFSVAAMKALASATSSAASAGSAEGEGGAGLGQLWWDGLLTRTLRASAAEKASEAVFRELLQQQQVQQQVQAQAEGEGVQAPTTAHAGGALAGCQHWPAGPMQGSAAAAAASAAALAPEQQLTTLDFAVSALPLLLPRQGAAEAAACPPLPLHAHLHPPPSWASQWQARTQRAWPAHWESRSAQQPGQRQGLARGGAA